MREQLETPVVLLIFNRPAVTAQVLAALRQVAPKQLLVVADGPRVNQPADVAKCAATRALLEHIDWPCDLQTNFAETNLGCGVRPATGISWAFEQVERAILLEDDCLPHPSFFPFAETLLEKYAATDQVMHIGGSNFLFGRMTIEDSYYFSRYPLCWGWATWRRAWQHFDFEMTAWTELRKTNWLETELQDNRASWYWRRIFDYVQRGGRTHIWDYQWIFSCWQRKGLCIVPQTNLISNLGFGHEATHTTRTSRFAALPAKPLNLPLRHPASLERNINADRLRQNDLCSSRLMGYAKDFVKKLIGKQ